MGVKEKVKMKLVRVQASSTRGEPVRVSLPASRCREEQNEELQRGLEQRGVEYPLAQARRIIGNPAREDDAGWCRSSQPASRRGGAEPRGTEPRGIDYPRA